MPAWAEARRAGQTARCAASKERADPKHNFSAGYYKFDAEDRLCFFCRRRKNKMTTGYMIITGAIWKCPDCEDKYQEEKKWEEQNR